MQIRQRLSVAIALLSIAAGVSAQSVVRDLEALSPVTLTQDEMTTLIPGAKMARVVSNGATQSWQNDADGTFSVVSDNSGGRGRTWANGKWHLPGDGRYCVLIEWRHSPVEEWCRFVVRTTSGYFLTRSATSATERVFPIKIDK